MILQFIIYWIVLGFVLSSFYLKMTNKAFKYYLRRVNSVFKRKDIIIKIITITIFISFGFQIMFFNDLLNTLFYLYFKLKKRLRYRMVCKKLKKQNQLKSDLEVKLMCFF